ncbi:MAG: glycosyltransferase family 2 protein [bacterium]|nr:glycosyltransferase family 2 protein [bacterium]
MSVVIPTRNRSALLREAIQAVWSQDFAPADFEIVVIDNLSTDDTEAMVGMLRLQSPCRMTYHRMDVNLGPANSRNKGVELARGKLIAFTDDDCCPAPGWLKLGARAFTDDSVALVTGQVLYKPGQEVKFFSRASGEAPEEHPTYPTCNAWYRRNVFQELGGFDMRLCFRDFRDRPVECADSDLAWRVKEARHSNVFEKDMVVFHEVERLPPLKWAMEPFRLFVVPELVRRHPQLRRELLTSRLFFMRENAWFYLLIAGLGLAIACHWAFVALALPYTLWAARAGNPRLTVLDLPKMVARAGFIGTRQMFMCAGLIYGSIRFRALVL